ncbi:hypothetical protein RSAG8_07356, partial [Rhizoctonia solani AG-8 WAC10335]
MPASFSPPAPFSGTLPIDFTDALNRPPYISGNQSGVELFNYPVSVVGCCSSVDGLSSRHCVL